MISSSERKTDNQHILSKKHDSSRLSTLLRTRPSPRLEIVLILPLRRTLVFVQKAGINLTLVLSRSGVCIQPGETSWATQNVHQVPAPIAQSKRVWGRRLRYRLVRLIPYLHVQLHDTVNKPILTTEKLPPRSEQKFGRNGG